MLDDFTPIIHTLPGRTTRVYALGDVHIGASEFNMAKFREWVGRIADDDDAYAVLCGDLINNGIRSSSCPTDIYDQAIPQPQAQIEKAVELLQPIADKILASVGGNHELRSTKSVGLEPGLTIAYMLRRSDGGNVAHLYRTNMAFVRVILANGNTKNRFAIMVTHGKSKRKNEQFTRNIEGIDAAIYGHTHTPEVTRPSSIRFGTNNKITVHNTVALTACSWLDAGGYGLRELYPQQATSLPQCLELEFSNTNTRNGDIRVVW